MNKSQNVRKPTLSDSNFDLYRRKRKPTLSDSNFALRVLIGHVNHLINLARQRELREYHIPLRQYEILSMIHDLGSKATAAEVAKEVERKVNSVTRQAVLMEKDGLITRVQNSTSSKLLRLELTRRGIDMIKLARKSKSLDTTFSFLSTEERQQIESILNRMLINLKKPSKYQTYRPKVFDKQFGTKS